MSKAADRRAARRPHRRGAGVTVAVAVRRLPGRDPALPLPGYATDGAAGMDLCANLAPERRAAGLTLAPGRAGAGALRASPSPSRRASRCRCGRAPGSRCATGVTLRQQPRHHRQRLSRRGRGDPRQPRRRALHRRARHAHRPAGAGAGRAPRLARRRRRSTTAPAAPAASARPAPPARAVTPDELARYARHIVLHEIGGAGPAAADRGAGARRRRRRARQPGAALPRRRRGRHARHRRRRRGRAVEPAAAGDPRHRRGRPAEGRERGARARPAEPARRRRDRTRCGSTPPPRPSWCRATTSCSTAATTSPPATSSTPPASPPASRWSRRR